MKYPDRTVAAARALRLLGLGPTRTAALLNAKKEAVSAWVNQGWRKKVPADMALYGQLVATIAPFRFSVAEGPASTDQVKRDGARALVGPKDLAP